MMEAQQASGFSRDGSLDLVCWRCVDDRSLAEFVSTHDRDHESLTDLGGPLATTSDLHLSKAF